MIARELMTPTFHTLHPGQSIAQAVQAFKDATAAEKRKIFGMMVTDDQDHLVGMLSMYDILNYVQPKHVSLFGEMDDLDFSSVYRSRHKTLAAVYVDDIMTTEVVTIAPDTHISVIAELMIKKHIRRLPVVENRDVKGIVYITAVFYELMTLLSGEEDQA